MLNEVKPVVLMFNLEEGPRKDQIKNYLTAQGIEPVDVPSALFVQPLGYLLGMDGFERSGEVNLGRDFKDEMLIMFAFTREMLNGFLQFFKDEQVAPVALKAMVTPTNINWNPADLHDELVKEHEYMSKR